MSSFTSDLAPRASWPAATPGDVAPQGNSQPRGRILVLGAGVSGLTTALCLSRVGYCVTVLADRFAPNVTSVVAGALWEWPPAVCGHHDDPVSLRRSKHWCEASYQIFGELARDPATGVSVRPSNFYFHTPIDDIPAALAKVQELPGKVAGFRRDSALIAENGINPNLGLVDAYTHLAPTVDTDVYMQWLLAECLKAGCRFVTRQLFGTLRSLENDLLREFNVEAIVNCTGLGSAALAEDEVRPLRGALVRIRNDGRQIPRITQAHCISRVSGNSFVFVLPRGDDMLVLGGIAELDESGFDIGVDDYEPVRTMYHRCIDFMPVLRSAEIDAAEPVRVGLRPFRPGNVRLEREAGTKIIHNYGHGGSGVTFSWGCSAEATDLVSQLVGTNEGRP